MTGYSLLSNRNGRRITIAGAILMLAALTAWWHWPRTDARFAGKWKVVDSSGIKTDPGEVRFHANGTGSVHMPMPKGFDFTWTVVDGELQVLDHFIRPPTSWDRISAGLARILPARWYLHKTKTGTPGARYSFRFGSPDEIHHSHLSGSWTLPTDVYVLQRITE